MSLAKRMEERGFDSDSDDSDAGEVRERKANRSCVAVVTSALLQVGVYLKLNSKDISARKGTYCLGVASCFVVVLITALMLTVLGRLPIVFMRLAELEEGEADLLLAPGGEASKAQSLNYSRVLSKSIFGGDRSASYHAPRVEFEPVIAETLVRNLNRCRTGSGAAFNPADPTAFYPLWQTNPNTTLTAAPVAPGRILTAVTCSEKQGCPEQYCDVFSAFAVQLKLVDLARENRMQLGRAWDLTSPPPGGCIIHQDLADRLGVGVGGYILLQADVSWGLLQAFIDSELDDWLEAPYTTWGRLMMPLRVSGLATGNNGGKFPADLTDYVLVDFASSLRAMAPFLNPRIGARKRQLFADADPHAMANKVIFNFPPDRRTDMYSQTDAADVLADATAFATPIIATLGFNQVDVEMPIVQNIRNNRFFSLFLGLILSLMILGLGFLCIVLIHSLLTVGVETRTFELGIMRMVGMTRGMLSGYVVTGALLFAIPAWALGLAVSQLLFLLIVDLLEGSLGVAISPMLTPDAIGYATLVGLGMPLVSSIAPIVQVLALDLPKALDTSRSKTTAIEYDIQKGGEYHVSWEAAGIGLAMAIAGFLIYYLFPLALITFNITLLFYIFFGILMGMLFGLVLLTTSLEGVVEICVMYVFLWWESPAVLQMIKKNLIAHRKRNRKTTLMFAMSIGFLIFLSVTFSIQIQSVLYAEERTLGGSISVGATKGAATVDGSSATVSFAAYTAVEQRLLRIEGNVSGGLRWGYVSASVPDQLNLDNATCETVGRYVTLAPFTAAVSPNFFDIVLSKYLLEKEVRDSSWPMSESLYSYGGSARALIGTSHQKAFALTSLDDAFVLKVKQGDGNTSKTLHALIQSEAWLDAAPVVTFSKYTTVGTSVITSVPAMFHHGDDAPLSVENMRFLRFVVDAGGESTTKYVKAEIEAALLESGLSAEISVSDVYATRSRLSVATTVITAFFVFAQAMATFICYFALSSSMSTNIHEQAKEIGVLRCIGFRKAPMTRTYVWEAFVLVCASSLLGIGVGVVMGYTIVLQRALFTQLPLPFVFPWVQLLVVLALSFALALLSSFAPIRAMLATRSVSSILKRAL